MWDCAVGAADIGEIDGPLAEALRVHAPRVDGAGAVLPSFFIPDADPATRDRRRGTRTTFADGWRTQSWSRQARRTGDSRFLPTAGSFPTSHRGTRDEGGSQVRFPGAIGRGARRPGSG